MTDTTATDTTDTTDTDTETPAAPELTPEQQLAFGLLEGFVAICHAPDDRAVRDGVNADLKRLDALLAG